MRIFLCEPNIPVKASRFEPLGLCTISSFLQSKGHTVIVYQQFGQSDEKVGEEIVRFEPDIAGFSCIDVNSPGALNIAKMLKEQRPDTFVVFGGERPTANPIIAQNPAVDLVVIGEGEVTLLEVIEQVESGENDFSKVKGTAFFDGQKLIVTKPRDRIADLGSLPLPDRHILGAGRYHYYGLTPSDIGLPSNKLSVASTYLSRGCTHNCRFCTTPNVWGRRWIARPVDDVVDEIEQMTKNDINFVYFQDENFLTNLDVVRKFCEMKIERGLTVPFSIISRVSHVDEPMVDLLYKAGLRHIGVGIESVRDETLKEIHKGLDISVIKEKVGIIRKRGISVCGLFMIGYPWETADMINGYSPVIRDLGVDSIKIQFLTPFMGTSLYEEASKKGEILTTDPLANSTETPVLKSAHLSPEDMLKLRKKLYLRFYLSPKFILRIARLALKYPSLIPDYLTRFYWFLRR